MWKLIENSKTVTKKAHRAEGNDYHRRIIEVHKVLRQDSKANSSSDIYFSFNCSPGTGGGSGFSWVTVNKRGTKISPISHHKTGRNWKVIFNSCSCLIFSLQPPQRDWATAWDTIVGTLFCLLALSMLVSNIWWLNCHKQHEREKESTRRKKHRLVEVYQLFVTETDVAVHKTWAYLQELAMVNAFSKFLFCEDNNHETNGLTGNKIFLSSCSCSYSCSCSQKSEGEQQKKFTKSKGCVWPWAQLDLHFVQTIS